VVLKEEVGGLTFGEMTDFLLRKQIAKQKLPERLEVIPELPRTVTGKVQKFKLREEIAQRVREE
jgi:non-ribosomal peptide synthetase component E (peptide arylation enzyme)